MILTRIEKIDKLRVQVEFDQAEGFWLYRKDASKLMLREGMEVQPKEYERIRLELVLLYAKKKTLALLERMDYTKQQLFKKLQQYGYSEDIAHQAITYAESFHYVDDYRFASNFIQTRLECKSKKQIFFLLYQKGISQELAVKAYEDVISERMASNEAHMENPEIIAIQKILCKKRMDITKLTKEEQQKLMASFYRKGFSIHSIRNVLDRIVE